MRTLRVCIGTNDGNNIAKTHMGDTETFVVYDLDEEHSSFVEQRQNVVKDLDHAQSDKMKQILNIVKDVNVLIAEQKSPNFIKIAQQTRYQPVVVKSESIITTLEIMQSHMNDIRALVERRMKGEFPDTIPELG